MNKRTVCIAQDLARADTTHSLSGLAAAYNVSSRTIRNDITALNRFLEEKGLRTLEYGPNGTIIVHEDFPNVLAFLPSQGFYSYKLSSEERKTLAAVVLADAADYVTIADIAELFSVSRATILKDLDGIKASVRDAGLKMISRPNHGLKAQGDEMTRRRFLLGFLLLQSPISKQWASQYVSKDVVDAVDGILGKQSHLHDPAINDVAFQVARHYLYIAVSRCRRGESVGRVDEKSSHSIPAGVWSYAHSVVEQLSRYCGMEMGEGEVGAFAEVLLSGRYRSDVDFSIEDVYIQTVTRKFVAAVSLALGIDLNGDYELFELLSNHLESIFASNALRFPVNSSLREVVIDQPQALDAVKDNLPILEAYCKRRITEVETIYVALHICAALERRKNMERRLRVVVACDEGAGTAQYVVEGLRGKLDTHIIKVIPIHETPYLDPSRADLVISTAPLKNCPIDSVVATLPFTDRDYARIRAKIDEVRSLGVGESEPDEELGARGLLARIEPILRRELPDGDGQLIREIRNEVRLYFHEAQRMEEEILTPYLHQLLPASHIQLDVEATDWKDAISWSARPLVEQGYVEPRYVDAMIDNVVRNGPYIVLTPHFAIPHEAPSNGVLKIGMNLIRLAHPVSFGHEENDPVEFVCTLAPVDHKRHLKAFFNLLSLLSDESKETLQELRTARTPEDVAVILENAEYQIIV